MAHTKIVSFLCRHRDAVSGPVWQTVTHQISGSDITSGEAQGEHSIAFKFQHRGDISSSNAIRQNKLIASINHSKLNAFTEAFP